MLGKYPQTIAQAWHKWCSNVFEVQRLASILAKVAFRWMNGVSTHVLFVHQYLVRTILMLRGDLILTGHRTRLEHLEI
jgi:hypothetical protein